MDTDILDHINREEACQALATVRNLIGATNRKKQLDEARTNIESNELNVFPAVAGEPSYMRLCTMSDEDEEEHEEQELVMTVQGFLVQKLLPPVTSGQQLLTTKALQAKQSVHVVAFDDQRFKSAVDNLSYLQNIFRIHKDAQSIQPFHAREWRSFPMLTVSNRYFTRQALAPHEVLSTFKDNIDPDNILIRLARSSPEALVNLDENRVRYFERIPTDQPGMPFRFRKCSPERFQLGDMIQVDISFAMFYNHKKKISSMQPILRALYHLDSTQRLNAGFRLWQSTLKPPTKTKVLKRKLTALQSDEEDHEEESADEMAVED